MPNFHIVFCIGSIGVGKTTFLKSIEQHSGVHVFLEPVDIWSNLTPKTTPYPLNIDPLDRGAKNGVPASVNSLEEMYANPNSVTLALMFQSLVCSTMQKTCDDILELIDYYNNKSLWASASTSPSSFTWEDESIGTLRNGKDVPENVWVYVERAFDGKAIFSDSIFDKFKNQANHMVWPILDAHFGACYSHLNRVLLKMKTINVLYIDSAPVPTIVERLNTTRSDQFEIDPEYLQDIVDRYRKLCPRENPSCTLKWVYGDCCGKAGDLPCRLSIIKPKPTKEEFLVACHETLSRIQSLSEAHV
jgi:deoxyadenosine/deoxycytidine kinase